MLNDASYKVVKQLEAGIHGNIMTMTNWKNRKECCNLSLQCWLFVNTAEPINVFNVSSQCWGANVAWQKAVIYTATHPTRIVATFTKCSKACWRKAKGFSKSRCQNQKIINNQFLPKLWLERVLNWVNNCWKRGRCARSFLALTTHTFYKSNRYNIKKK